MTRHRLHSLRVSVVPVAICAIGIMAGRGFGDEKQPRDVEPLAEGPLHEAFLSPAKDKPPVLVEAAPPNPIAEKPKYRSKDDRAVWIPGYWEWDGSRTDFVWVTGTWRLPPPGRVWVETAWRRDRDGWFRVPGYWRDAKIEAPEVFPNEPPQDRPVEVAGNAPGAEHFYVPGQHFPENGRIVWKPGYWAKAQKKWAWVPAQWIRRPEGWVFSAGYWDRPLENRGLLFTPATVRVEVRANPDLVHQPAGLVNPNALLRFGGALAGSYRWSYDGYPGCYYDPYGRYYRDALYGNLRLFNGYLGYPYAAGIGVPYPTPSIGFVNTAPFYQGPFWTAAPFGAGVALIGPSSPFLPPAYGFHGSGFNFDGTLASTVLLSRLAGPGYAFGPNYFGLGNPYQLTGGLASTFPYNPLGIPGFNTPFFSPTLGSPFPFSTGIGGIPFFYNYPNFPGYNPNFLNQVIINNNNGSLRLGDMSDPRRSTGRLNRDASNGGQGRIGLNQESRDSLLTENPADQGGVKEPSNPFRALANPIRPGLAERPGVRRETGNLGVGTPPAGSNRVPSSAPNPPVVRPSSSASFEATRDRAIQSVIRSQGGIVPNAPNFGIAPRGADLSRNREAVGGNNAAGRGRSQPTPILDHFRARYEGSTGQAAINQFGPTQFRSGDPGDRPATRAIPIGVVNSSTSTYTPSAFNGNAIGAVQNPFSSTSPGGMSNLPRSASVGSNPSVHSPAYFPSISTTVAPSPVFTPSLPTNTADLSTTTPSAFQQAIPSAAGLNDQP